MKKLLFLILLLNFTFVSSLFAQENEELESETKHSYPTSKQIINLFQNLKNQLKTESNFDKIDYRFIEKEFLNNTT